MPSKFNLAIDTVLRHEGGYVNHPSDPGGATNYGVTLASLQNLHNNGWLNGDLDGDGDVDPEDVRLLPREMAVEIYRAQWWDRYGYHRINDPALAAKVMDLSVNTGPGRAHKLLQQALRAVGHPVAIDGLLGPKTLTAANLAPSVAILAALRSEAAGFYRILANQRPQLQTFLAGWLNRAYA